MHTGTGPGDRQPTNARPERPARADREVAAEDVAQIQRDAQFYPPRAPGREEDDL